MSDKLVTDDPVGELARRLGISTGISCEIYLSDGASQELVAMVEMLAPRAAALVLSRGRAIDSCDTNAEAWTRLLHEQGWEARQVIDGVARFDEPIWHEDSGETVMAVGHDWVVVMDHGRPIILDAAIGQFDGHVPIYLEV